MNSIARFVTRSASLLGLLAAVACSSAPTSQVETIGEAEGAVTSCGPLMTHQCTMNGAGSMNAPVGGSSLHTESTRLTCGCMSVCDQPTPSTCGPSVNVPAELPTANCLTGVQTRNNFLGISTVWGCTDGTTVPNSIGTTYPSCEQTGGAVPCQVVNWGSSLIDSACLGSTESGWTFIEQQVLFYNPDGITHGCGGGCNHN
jgi:hypothetical protein